MTFFAYTGEAMSQLFEHMKQNPVFYVTRDIERALGLSVKTKGYFIISNFSEYSKKIAFGQENILLLEESQKLDTFELLNHPKTQEFISQITMAQPHILVFKNTSVIEKICSEKGYNLLNPSALLSQKVEEKISQIEWLGELAKYLPPHEVQEAKNISFDGTPFILQFNRAHTGLGTMKIENKKQLNEIQQKFPSRPVKKVSFINGPMFTSNNVVNEKNVLVGNISYQITGIKPFTENPFATIGNDFALPHKILNEKQIEEYREIVEQIGKKLRHSGWKGLFGVDIILDEQSGKLYLIEINARQPASTTFESQLQENTKTPARNPDSSGGGQKHESTLMTTFEEHLCALLGIDTSQDALIEITNGAQIIQRVNSNIQLSKQLEQVEQLEQLEQINIIPYENTDPGSDFLRIQVPTGIMKQHGELNETGLQIAQILES